MASLIEFSISRNYINHLNVPIFNIYNGIAKYNEQEFNDILKASNEKTPLFKAFIISNNIIKGDVYIDYFDKESKIFGFISYNMEAI